MENLTVLTDRGNNVDISKLSEAKLRILLSEAELELKDYNKMLRLPLGDDERGIYNEMINDCLTDISIINSFLNN